MDSDILVISPELPRPADINVTNEISTKERGAAQPQTRSAEYSPGPTSRNHENEREARRRNVTEQHKKLEAQVDIERWERRRVQSLIYSDRRRRSHATPTVNQIMNAEKKAGRSHSADIPSPGLESISAGDSATAHEPHISHEISRATLLSRIFISSWPKSIKTSYSTSTSACNTILLPCSHRFIARPALFPCVGSDPFEEYMDSLVQNGKYIAKEPPLCLFGMSATGLLPDFLKHKTTLVSSMEYLSSKTDSLVYTPRVAYLKETVVRAVCTFATLAVRLDAVESFALLLRSSLRIAASWGHIHLVLDFTTLAASLGCRSKLSQLPLVDAIKQVFQEEEFLGRWKRFDILTALEGWEGTELLEEEGIEVLLI